MPRPFELSRQVASLESRAAQLERLCREVLDALRLDVSREKIRFATEEDSAEYSRLLLGWQAQFDRAVANIPLPFPPPAKPDRGF